MTSTFDYGLERSDKARGLLELGVSYYKKKTPRSRGHEPPRGGGGDPPKQYIEQPTVQNTHAPQPEIKIKVTEFKLNVAGIVKKELQTSTGVYNFMFSINSGRESTSKS